MTALTLQAVEGFTGLNAVNFQGGAFCSVVDGGPGCGVGLNGVRGCIPPGTPTGGNSRWTSLGYTLVTNWNGTGLQLSNVTTTYFTCESGNLHDTWCVGGRVTPRSVAATAQQLISVGSGGRTLSVDVEVATGKLMVMRGGSGAGAGTEVAKSNTTVTAGTTYQIELLCYLNATGSFRVLLNGALVVWASGSGTGVNTGSASAGIFLHNPDANYKIGDTYQYAGDGGFTTDDHIATAERLPILSTLLPASQGNYSTWERYSGATGSTVTFQGAGNSTNYTYVDDTQCDGPLTRLQSVNANNRESWVMGPLSGAAGEALVVYTSICTVGQNTVQDIHELRIGGVDYDISALSTYTDSQFTNLFPGGATWQYTARHWTSNPASRGWDVADLAALQVGLKSQSNIDTYVTQARLMVLWMVPLPTDESSEDVELGAECSPCNEAKSARHYDSHLTYDGENTDTTKTMTLALAPGADWITIGLTHTLASSAPGSFLATDDDAPKKAFRLGDPDGDHVILDVVTYTSATSITVTNRSAVPLSLQATATSEWARMTTTVSGMGHLQGETVSANLDGIDYPDLTMTAGVVTFPVHAAVATVGLLILSEFETLDFDIPGQGRSVSALQKLVSQAFIQVDKSQGFDFISEDESETPASFLTAAEREDAPHLLVSRKEIFDLPGQWSKPGRVKIRHTQGLPLNILSVEPRIDAAGKQVG